LQPQDRPNRQCLLSRGDDVFGVVSFGEGDSWKFKGESQSQHITAKEMLATVRASFTMMRIASRSSLQLEQWHGRLRLRLDSRSEDSEFARAILALTIIVAFRFRPISIWNCTEINRMYFEFSTKVAGCAFVYHTVHF
jgi:hypothetical protein